MTLHPFHGRGILTHLSVLTQPVGIGWTAVFINILAASTYTPFAKQLTGFFTPLSLLFLSECISLLFLLLMVGVVPLLRSVRTLPPKLVLPVCTVGLLSGVFGPLLWFTGLGETTGINAAVFGNVDLIFTLTFSMLLLRERITHEQVVAALLILFGMIVVSTRGDITRFNGMQTGDLLIVLSAGCYSLGGIIYSKYLSKQQPHVILALRSAMGLASFALLLPLTGKVLAVKEASMDSGQLLFLIAFAVLSRLVPVLAYYHAIERLKVSTVSLVSYLSVIGGGLLSTLVFGEKLLSHHYTGALCIIVGTIIAESHGIERARAMLRHFRPHHPDIVHDGRAIALRSAPVPA